VQPSSLRQLSYTSSNASAAPAEAVARLSDVLTTGCQRSLSAPLSHHQTTTATIITHPTMSSSSTALTKRSASAALMPPPPAPKRIKRPSVVLDEDTYTSAVSHIIRRDFFPGLAEADAQREYLNAVESKDKAWIRESGRRLTHVMTPGRQRGVASRTRLDTPKTWGADTPRTVAGEDHEGEEDGEEDGLGKLDHVDLDMSLGAFQAKYTSEDQESFSALIDKTNKAKFDKKAWLHSGNRFASKQRLAQQKVIEARSDASSSTALVPRPSQDLDDRPAAPTMHKHSAFNSLMFAPDSVESWAPTRAAAAETASLAPPKQLRHANTRLPAVDTEPARPPSPTLSAIRDAVAGRPRLSASEVGSSGNETPRVNGYAFVDARPSPPRAKPSYDDDEDAPTDLLTRYGITSSASSTTPFTIADASAREKMHHKMVDRIGTAKSSSSSSKSAATTTATATAKHSGLGIFASETPRFLSAPTPRARAAAVAGGATPKRRAVGDLTPAAQRLLERVGGATPRRAGGGFGDGRAKGREEWTPGVKGRKGGASASAKK
jgi:protein DGCR14